MFSLNLVGQVTTTPELKVSVKGTQYLKFTVEVPQPEGRWSKRVGVTVFGNQAVTLAAQIPAPGCIVSVVGEPEARGYLDKTNKPRGALDCVGREVRVLVAAGATRQAQPEWTPPGEELTTLMVAAAGKEPNLGEDDIPF